MPYGWGYPIYYDEAGYPITATPTTAYAATPVPGSPSTQVPSSNQPAASGTIAEGDWMPLGVFAVDPDINQPGVSSMVIQLALNKNGELYGTYYNMETNKALALEGFVDQNTQQAAWQVADRSGPFMFTGIIISRKMKRLLSCILPMAQSKRGL